MIAEPKKPSRKYTLDEYLALEAKSEIRHEFYNGKVYAMAGGALNHNLLIDSVKDIIKGQREGMQGAFRKHES